MLLAKSCLLEFRIYLWLILLHCKKKKIFQSYCKFFFFFRTAVVGFVVYGTQKRGTIGMGGVGKGVGTVYPLYPGIFVLLKKNVQKCVFQSLNTGYKLLQSSSNKKNYLHVHEPKCLPSF